MHERTGYKVKNPGNSNARRLVEISRHTWKVKTLKINIKKFKTSIFQGIVTWTNYLQYIKTY